jgi:hypothetical protein
MIKLPRFDQYLFIGILLYTVLGFLIFFSASLGLMARNEDKFFAVLNNQFFYGIVLGLIGFAAGILIPYGFWKKLSYPKEDLAIVIVDNLHPKFGSSFRFIEEKLILSKKGYCPMLLFFHKKKILVLLAATMRELSGRLIMVLIIFFCTMTTDSCR